MVIRVVRNLFWASSSQFIQPINQLGVSATLIDETGRGHSSRQARIFHKQRATHRACRLNR
jgi:hypothetical protein